MSVYTPTLLPRPPVFPTLLPRPPQPHPVPFPRRGTEDWRLNLRRDLVRDMEDLSDEEAELEDITNDVKIRGYGFIVPIGRTYTQHEEKNDADESEEDSDQAAASPVATDEPSETEEAEEEEEEEGADLDAEMEDLDEQPSFGAASDGEDLMPASIEDSD
ncbi:unnamed protein product [Peniophora sp. CBMAI 1063]|nr:unnamed protein product [Peniophora sp. CBMAI 1063]